MIRSDHNDGFVIQTFFPQTSHHLADHTVGVRGLKKQALLGEGHLGDLVAPAAGIVEAFGAFSRASRVAAAIRQVDVRSVWEQKMKIMKRRFLLLLDRSQEVANALQRELCRADLAI